MYLLLLESILIQELIVNELSKMVDEIKKAKKKIISRKIISNCLLIILFINLYIFFLKEKKKWKVVCLSGTAY